MMLPSRRAFRMWQRNRDVFFRLWCSLLPGFFIEPIILLVALGFGFGSFMGVIDEQDYIQFIVPGIIAGYAMSNAVFECSYGVYFRMEYRRTYDSVLATPLSVEDVITGEILWASTRSLITSVIILMVAFGFGLLPSPLALLVPFVAVLEGLMFASLTMVFTSLVPSVYSFSYFFTLFITPITFFSGAFFPLDSFPETIQTVGNIVPLTPAVNVIRSLINGEFSVDLLPSVLYFAVLTVIFFIMALRLMKRRIIE